MSSFSSSKQFVSYKSDYVSIKIGCISFEAFRAYIIVYDKILTMNSTRIHT